MRCTPVSGRSERKSFCPPLRISLSANLFGRNQRLDVVIRRLGQQVVVHL